MPIRFVTSGGVSIDNETSGDGPVVEVDDFAADPGSPLFRHHTRQQRWLIATCVVGLAGSAIVGASLTGLLDGDGPIGVAEASLNPAALFQRTTVAAKGDYLGNINDLIASPHHAARYRSVSVAYRPTGKTGPIGKAFYRSLDTDEPVVASYSPDAARANTDDGPQVLDNSFNAVPDDADNVTDIAKSPPAEPIDKTIILKPGSTLIAELTTLGVSSAAAESLARAIEPVYPTRLLRQGQSFVVTLDRQLDFSGNEVTYPVRVSFKPSAGEEIIVEADEDGRFVARSEGADAGAGRRLANAAYYHTRARISSSLYASALDHGIPDYIVNQMIRAFTYDVDFQREVKQGDTFDVFFGKPLSGSSNKRKVLHYAALKLTGKTKVFYRFTPPGGQPGYYDENGRSATKALMRTPLSGARISSGFGMRRHPILGYTRMHTGVDFAAPRGTPIRAAGSGTVIAVGRMGALGNAVKLKHAQGYSTVYAHMNRVVSGLKKGMSVRQGQVIGYVGSTGRSTGPHLHYEVRINGKPINPLKVRIAGGSQLTGKALQAFNLHKRKIMAMMLKAPSSTRLASAGN